MRSKPPSRPGGARTSSGPNDKSASPRDPAGRAPGGKPFTPRAASAKPAGRSGPPRDRHGGPRPSTPRPPAERTADARPPRPKAPPEAPRPEEAAAPERPILRAPAVPAEPRRESQAPPGPRAPSGSMWLHGTHAVAAALRNPARRLRRLLLTEEAEAALAARVPQPWPLAPERTERPRLDHLLGKDTVHQGVGLLADPLPQPTLAGVLERPGPVLVLDQVSDPRNVGAVLRSAAAFGVAAVITQDRNAPEETGALAKAASGALETVPLLRAVNLARTLVALKAAGLWVVGLDANAPALAGGALAERRVALVLGAEGAGLRRLTRETCDELAGLHMPGTMESLNVSAAATVALYELSRAR